MSGDDYDDTHNVPGCDSLDKTCSEPKATNPEAACCLVRPIRALSQRTNHGWPITVLSWGGGDVGTRRLKLQGGSN